MFTDVLGAHASIQMILHCFLLFFKNKIMVIPRSWTKKSRKQTEIAKMCMLWKLNGVNWNIDVYICDPLLGPDPPLRNHCTRRFSWTVKPHACCQYQRHGGDSAHVTAEENSYERWLGCMCGIQHYKGTCCSSALHSSWFVAHSVMFAAMFLRFKSKHNPVFDDFKSAHCHWLLWGFSLRRSELESWISES